MAFLSTQTFTYILQSAYWGEDVQVGVTTDNEDILFVELSKLQPYHWTRAYSDDELEKFIDAN